MGGTSTADLTQQPLAYLEYGNAQWARPTLRERQVSAASRLTAEACETLCRDMPASEF